MWSWWMTEAPRKLRSLWGDERRRTMNGLFCGAEMMDGCTFAKDEWMPLKENPQKGAAVPGMDLPSATALLLSISFPPLAPLLPVWIYM